MRAENELDLKWQYYKVRVEYWLMSCNRLKTQ